MATRKVPGGLEMCCSSYQWNLFVAMLFVVLSGCAGTRDISDGERAKLDARLQGLFSNVPVLASDYDVSTRSDGTEEYGVIIHGTNPDEVRVLGVHVADVFGDIMIARASIDEIRQIIALASVRSVEGNSKHQPQ